MRRRWLVPGMLATFLWLSPLFAEDDAVPKRIAQWVADLNDDAFAVREAAVRSLVAAGKPAIQPVAQAAVGRSLEVTTRAFRILRELADSADAETVESVKKALHNLAASADKAASARAVDALRLFQDRAAGKLKEGGASVNTEGDKIVGVSFGDVKITALNQRLLHELPDLTFVSVNKWDDDALGALRGLKKVSQLNLYQSRVTDAGVAHLKYLPALKSVAMGETKVTDAGLIHLKNLTQLEYLGLRGNAVSDAGLVHLKELTNLTGLYLGETKVTDAGLVHLKGMTKMQYLRLHTVAVSDAGLEHLKGMSALQQLDLWDTKVTEAGVAKLREALPNVRAVTKLSQ